MLTLVSGTAMGQVVALLGAPVLSRLFTPADFGVLAVVTALAAVLATVSALRLELSVPLPREESTAYAIVHVGLCAIAVTATLGTAVLLLFGDEVAAAFGQPQLMPWLAVTPAVAAALATFIVLNALGDPGAPVPGDRPAQRPAVHRHGPEPDRSRFRPLAARGSVVGYGIGQAVGAVSCCRARVCAARRPSRPSLGSDA